MVAPAGALRRPGIREGPHTRSRGSTPGETPMPNAFNFSVSPFDCLDPAEQRLVRDQVDIACSW